MECEVCRAKCHRKCSACEEVSYCCEGHQKQDWKRHKIMCKLTTSCRREVSQSRDPFDYQAQFQGGEEDPGKPVSFALVIENIRNGGNGTVPSSVQAYIQFLDSCLTSFDTVKSVLIKVRKDKVDAGNDDNIVQRELNECMNHFKIRYRLSDSVLDEFERIHTINTFSSTDRMDEAVHANELVHQLIIQVSRQEFGSKQAVVVSKNALRVEPWPYPWALARDGEWSHALLTKYGQVTELDRRLQANLLESAVFPKATQFALSKDEYMSAMKRRMMV
ncbi:hypothetical protein BASA81_005108 [Batrachochytrium salamandrivorans]|nr:hypothetical protein BASA81_005108 [Batrachochytrium salamandrivorans]